MSARLSFGARPEDLAPVSYSPRASRVVLLAGAAHHVLVHGSHPRGLETAAPVTPLAKE
jgi:hypothetical protein